MAAIQGDTRILGPVNPSLHHLGCDVGKRVISDRNGSSAPCPVTPDSNRTADIPDRRLCAKPSHPSRGLRMKEAANSPTASPISRRSEVHGTSCGPPQLATSAFLKFVWSRRAEVIACSANQLARGGSAMLAEKFFLVLETLRSIASAGSVRVVSTTPHVPVEVPPQK
jgi:hypothetical protein